MRVGICIITYNRTRLLSNLLNSINKIELKKHKNIELSIIIVDNDKNRSAKEVAYSFLRKIKFNLYYVHEPERGIASARNAAVRFALEKRMDFIAFIDDDEIVSSNWLENILEAQSYYKADVVKGPVIPIYDEKIPNWIKQSGYFERKRYKTGTIVKDIGIGNTLIRAQLFNNKGSQFDLRFNLTGGEDTYFFKRVESQGAKIIWCDDAIVKEYIPASRGNIKWILLREFRTGSTYTICEKLMGISKKMLLQSFLKSVFKIIYGMLLIIPRVFLGKRGIIQSLILISNGLGNLAGLFNIHYNEYKKIHGS